MSKINSKPRTRLYRVRLNSGGYDATGSYYGHGAPLYAYDLDDSSGETRNLRAQNREQAKIIIRRLFPHATFYR